MIIEVKKYNFDFNKMVRIRVFRTFRLKRKWCREPSTAPGRIIKYYGNKKE